MVTAFLMASSGIECRGKWREGRFDLLVLEAPLPWGGSEGVLEVIQTEARWQALPVILVAVGVVRSIGCN